MTVPLLAAVASPVQIVVFLGAIIAVVAAVSWLLTRRRRDIWKELARRRGLQFDERPEGPRVTGTLNGRRVEIAIAEQSSDTEAGVAVVDIAVEVRALPRGMSVEGVPGLVGDLATLGQDRIEIGSESFDRDVLVKSDDDLLARTYWDLERQQAFLHLLQTSPCDQISMRHGTLVAELRSVVSDRRQLQRLLDLLLDAAQRLDGDAARDGE